MFHGNKPGGMLEKAAATPERQNLLQQKLETNKNKLVDYKPEGRPAKMEGLAQFTAEKLEKNRNLLVDYKTPEVSAAKASGVFFGKRLKEKMPGELTEQEAKELRPIYSDFVKAFRENMDKPDSGWMEKLLEKYLPDIPKADIRCMAQETTETIRKNDAARKGGDKLGQMGSATNTIQKNGYMKEIDHALEDSNDKILETVMRKDLKVNMNPNLDGFIAERYHVETFNVNAVAKKSPWRARVEVPAGAYGKNSVDVVIYHKDNPNKIIRRYQFKYGANAKATERMLNNGSYDFQRILVPKGQSQDIGHKSVEFLESPDGKVRSTALSKADAKKMQENAQKLNAVENDLSIEKNVATKDLVSGIGKQGVQSFLIGGIYGAGKETLSQWKQGETLDVKKIEKSSLEDGGDFAAKQMLAGLLTVGSEKKIIGAIPPGTSSETIASISYAAIEDAKIAVKVGKGELTAAEGAGRVVETTVSTGAGVFAAGKGGLIGKDIGGLGGAAIASFAAGPEASVVGAKVGAAVGEVVGSGIGYLVGSGAAESFIKGAKEMLNNLTESTTPQVATV